MPLLDHFHPPLSQRRHWDSFHGAWAEAIALQLNQSLLPPRYVAEARVKLGGQLEIDVAALEEVQASNAMPESSVAVWAPPLPTAVATLPYTDLDSFAVEILNEEEGPRVVAAIELVSPANKDRPANRQQFCIKCAAYLQAGAAVTIIDVVTQRSANLHLELLDLLEAKAATPVAAPKDLYACSYRTLAAESGLRLEIWAETLALGRALPTLPLWIHATICLPLDLEDTYQASCAARRIE
jgi:hypothetical protein